MISNFEPDLDTAKTTQQAKYLRQRQSHLKVIAHTNRHCTDHSTWATTVVSNNKFYKYKIYKTKTSATM